MLNFISKLSVISFFLTATISASDTTITLSEQYNLGRVIDGPTIHSYTEGSVYSSAIPGGSVLPRLYHYAQDGSYFDKTEDLFHQSLSGYIGIEDRYQLGARLLEFGVSDTLTTAVFLEQLLLTLKPKEGHRLFFELQQENLYTGMRDDTLGFSAYTPNFSLDSEWDLLTRNGTISVNDEEYALAYLSGPLLDKKQYRQSLGIYQECAVDDDPNFDFEYIGALGLHEKAEITLGSSLYLGSSIKYIISAVPGITFRFNSSEIKASYTWGYAKYSRTPLSLHSSGDSLIHRYNKWSLQGGHLWNSQRNMNGASIESNWDNFYSSILHRGEMYSFLKSDLSTTKDPYTTRGERETDFSLFTSHRIGITDKFIAGGVFELFSNRLGDPEPNTGMLLQANILFHNLTAGTTTLNTADKKELLFGRILNRKSFITALSGALPLSGDFEEIGVALYDPYRAEELNEFSHSEKVEKSLITEPNKNHYDYSKNAHYALRSYYGLTNWCMIQGEFLGYLENEWEEFDYSWGVGGTFHSSQKLYAQLLCEFFPTDHGGERGTSFSLNLNGLF